MEPDKVEDQLKALFVRFQQEFEKIVISEEQKWRERERQLVSERQALEEEKECLQREKEQMNIERERLQREREQFRRDREELEGTVNDVDVQPDGQQVQSDAGAKAPAPSSVDPSVFASRDIRFFPDSPADKAQQDRQKTESVKVTRQRTELPEPDKVVKDTVFVTHVTSPSDFMVQLVSDGEALTSVMKRLQTVGNSPEMYVNHFIEGKMYSGRFTDDDAWYRVKVNALSANPPFGFNPPLGSSVLVTYVDFGNSEWLSADRIRLLPEGLESVPSLAKTCCIADLVPLAKERSDEATRLFVKEWLDEATHLFVEVTSDLPLEMKICRQVGNVMFVDLLDVSSRAAELGYSQCSTVKDVLLASGHAVIDGSPRQLPSASGQAGTTSSVSQYVKQTMSVPTGSRVSVILSHVESLDEIYVQLESDQVELNGLMIELQEVFKGQETSNMAITDPHQGQPICCQFSADEHWYRAEITEVVGPRCVSVVYVDYGNIEKVDVASIRMLPVSMIYRLPAQAVRCSLVDVVKNWEQGKEWPEEVVQQLSDFINSSQLSVVVKGVRGTVVDVDLLDSFAGSVSQLLLHTLGPSQRDKRSNPPTEAFSAVSGEPTRSHPATLLVNNNKQLVLQPNQMSLIANELPSSTNFSLHNRVWSGAVSHVDSPSQFYVQVQGDNALQDVMSKVASHCKNAASPPDPVVWSHGSLCCARFSEDGTWYRARVLGNLPDKKISVLYIDFGNSEVLSRKELRLLPYDCRNVPAQAVKCCIYDATPVMVDKDSSVVGGWSRQAVSVMNELVGTSLCHIEQKIDSDIDDNSQPIMVDIRVKASDGQICSLRDVLIQRGLAEPRDATPALSAMKLNTSVTSEIISVTSRCYSPPRIPDSRQFSALVTCVDKNCSIYAYATQDAEEVSLVTDKLQEHLAGKTSGPWSAEQWEVGQSCCARFAFDNNWYRARIVRNIDERRVEVFYVDYGNDEIVELDWLDAEVAFPDIPCLALTMQLKGLEKENHSLAVAAKLSEVLLEKCCKVQVLGELESGTGNSLVVNVEVDGQNVLAMLNESSRQKQQQKHQQDENKGRYALHYQSPPADSLPLPDKLLSSVNAWQDSADANADANADSREECGVLDERIPATEPSRDIETSSLMLESSVDAEDFRQPQLPPTGVTFTVQVTHVVTPDTVYLQRLGIPTLDQDDTLQEAVKQLERLQHMAEVLNNPSTEFHSLVETDIVSGIVCSVQYSHDNLWYRARVVEVLNKTIDSLLIKVMYVDYGTSETVTFDRIRSLPLEFHRLPAQSVVVHLPGIEPVPCSDAMVIPGSQWTVTSLKAMAQLVTAKQFVATIKSRVNGYCVHLTDSQGNGLTDELVSAGLARKSP